MQCCFQGENGKLKKEKKKKYIYIYIYIYIIVQVSRLFSNDIGDQDSILDRVILKIQKWYLIPPCLTLSIIRYISRVSRAIQGNELCPPLLLDVVATGKGAFKSLLTTFFFGLVTLFNGISTFVGYLMPKPFSKKNSSGSI